MEELFTMILRKSRLGFNSGVVSMRNKWGELEGTKKKQKGGKYIKKYRNRKRRGKIRESAMRLKPEQAIKE